MFLPQKIAIVCLHLKIYICISVQKMSNDPSLSYKENENIFRTLIEESPTPVGLYVGREMVIHLANQAILKVWGKDESIIGKTFSQALPELEGQPFFQLLDDVYTSGIAYEATEDRVDLLANGQMQTFYFNFIYKPLKDKEGNVWGILNTATDVTELVITRQKLAASEDRIQFALDSAELGTWDIDRLAGTIIWNNRCRELYGFREGEKVTITNVRDHVHPDDAERITESVRIAVDPKTGGDYDDTFRIISPIDQKITWIKCKGKAYFNNEGVCTRFSGTTLDITKDIQTREEQQRLLKQFEFVTGFMPVQLWTAKTDGELDYVNERTVEYFGVPAEDIVGPAWQTFVHPDDFAACIDVWAHSLTTGDPYQFEFRLKDKEGVYKWHLARALPFKNDGEIVKWFGTNTDIDDQKQLQRQKDDFLGIASHELKTPVTSIKAYAQVLGAMLTKEGETKKAEMVLRMDAQVNRLTNLIGDLLDVTKINSGRLQFNKTWFDFNQVIKETVEDLQHTTQKHTLTTDFSKTGKVYSDKDRIGQVITNLITNAIKYSPQSEKIIISTKLENAEVTVCVQDFGIGIPTDKTDRVFEQFYRVSGNKQHTFPGLGLGLYISSEIIRREGGRMWVNSVEGKGSTFCFALPADDKETNTL